MLGVVPEIAIRDAVVEDRRFLEEMLVEAANAPNGQRGRMETLAEPAVAAYVDGWPRPTDLSRIAERNGDPAGAAWLRFFTADAPAYGFVREDIPELAIGVAVEHRGAGIGGALMRALSETARRRGLEGISLSVEHGNPAVSLYQAHGYRIVERRDNADTMLLTF